MSARDWLILRFESKRGGRGSLLRGMPFMNCPSDEDVVVEGCVAASVMGDAGGGIEVAEAEDDGDGRISVGVAWSF